MAGALGVTVFDGDEEGLVPMLFVAVTVNVYAVPSVRPVMVAVVAGGVPATVVGGNAALVSSAMCGVTVYDVIGLPPLFGAVHETAAVLSPADATTPVGVSGATAALGVTAFEFGDAVLLPTELVAYTVNVYPVPGVRPVMIWLVGGGEPATVTAGCALEPMYGVTV